MTRLGAVLAGFVVAALIRAAGGDVILFPVLEIRDVDDPRPLNALIDRLEQAPETVDPAQVGPEILRAVRAGGGHELLPFTGQSAQLVHDVAPAREVVARLVVEAERALCRAASAIRE